MLIRSLTLKDVKSYTLATVEFSPGTNAIVGDNGSGKTTILEAIGFALFDRLPYARDDFVREGRRSACVTVEFLSGFDERVYQVIRHCGSGSSSAYMVVDPELSLKICEGKINTSQFLRQHLGIEPTTDLPELFRNAVGVPQGSFTAAFLESPGRRKGIFDPLLKVAEYRWAYEKLRDPLRLLTQRQNDQAVIISGLRGQLDRLPSLTADAAELTTRIRNAEREWSATQTDLATAEASQQTLQTQRERLLALQHTAQMQKQAVDEQERTLAAARQWLTETAEAVAIIETNQAGHEAYQAALQTQRALNEQLAQRRQLQEERAAADKRLTLAATQKAAQERTLAEIAEAENTAAALTDAVAEQETLEAALRDAQRQADRLQDARDRVQREQAAVAAAEKRCAQMRADVAQGQKIEASLEPLQGRVETLQQTVTAEQAKAAQLRAERATVNEQITQLQAMETAICPVCEQPLPAAHRMQLLDRNRSRLAALNGDSQATAMTIRQAEAARRQARSTLIQREKTLRSLPPQNAVAIAETELTDLRGRLTETMRQAAALAEAPGRVQQLQQSLTTLNDPRRRWDVARQRAAERQQVEDALQKRRAEAERQRMTLAALDARMQAFADLDAEEAQLSATLDKFQTADDLYRRNFAAADAFPQRQQEVAEAESALQAAEALYAAGQAQLEADEREFDEDRFREAVAQVEEIRSRSVRLETNLGHWRERLARAQEEIDQLQAQAHQLAAAQALHNRLTEQHDLLQFLRSVLQEAGPFVTQALVQQISHAANQLFGEIMEDYTRTLQWRDDYGIILEVDGRRREFSQLSGGEQMTAALAVRLALLQEMSDIAVAFFDEPTANLDDARRSSLARQILGIRGFQQLFVISHDDTFEQATENLIRVEKKNGVSEIR